MEKIRSFLFYCFVLSFLVIRSVWADVNIIMDDIYKQLMENVDEGDLKKYKNIFKAIDKGDFKTADKLIDKIDSQCLLGYVKAEKYLHPAYKSTKEELEEWLNEYRDYPQATRIYKLAIKKGAKEIKEPVYHSDDAEGNVDKLSLKYLERLSPKNRKFLVEQAKSFRRHLRRGKTLAARNILENKKFQELAPKVYWDNLAAKLSIKYLVDNYDTKALEWGKISSKRHNSGVATWVAGLASWRKKNYKSAASYFARLGSSQNSDEWLKSAAAYWSYRAYEKLGNNLKAREMLKLAAVHKYTFYGILANYQLGEKFDYGFDQNNYIIDFDKMDYVNEVLASKEIVRALLLLKIGKIDLAEKEFYAVFDGLSDNQKEAVILLANQYGLHSLVINISRKKNIETLKGNYEKEIYPLPKWSSEQDWKVDKALILALIRQESAFKDNATSKAGARGIMQLMPNTAYHISGDKTVKKQKNKLLNLDYNLSLGQKYVSYLLSKPFIEGNLFYLLTAYNGGPGNLLKWKKNARFYNDPLLFIEVIPSAETRIYIERVMANYWIYNMRFGNKNHSLEQLAEGKWPVIKIEKELPMFVIED